ncbi:MAG: hypothetical protein Q8N47_22960 [Bryobacterales bacterium]|nr:hypothetical protein [Bryobacterales bacterium]
MNGRCCVFQPFDKGPYDKRYEDTIAPAIRDANLEPYRVDRDDKAVIPIETLHEEIRSATICLADITTNNANVMYELGFAIASRKDIVIISSTQRTERFPFDIQHRGYIEYTPDSASDFDKLKKDITNKLKALLKAQEQVQEIVSASPVKSTQGLQPHQIAALAFVLANREAEAGVVSTYTIRQNMRNAGYTELATSLALTHLSRIGFVETIEDHDLNGEPFFRYGLLTPGEDWLLENERRFELRLSERPPRHQRTTFEQGIADDDVPF